MIEIESDCSLSKEGLSIFAPTADQRYLLGADVFLRTHYPVTLRCYKTDGGVMSVSEDSLLAQLLDSAPGPGNRLWILYGAAGSGKSELMRWLETRIAQESTHRATAAVRISRTELDVLKITERFRSLLSEKFFSETTYSRWQAARQKPRTLTKLILLSALARLLDSDEAANALFYRLLDAVQPYIERILMLDETSEPARGIEMISLETWHAIAEETAIPMPLDYEQFRHQMTVVFRDHLLEGISLPDTMHRISDEVTGKHSQRPILLVDDLVQSLNLFATDLLDYLLTLEEGNWDVVLGLTPAAFEASERGRCLLQRIAHLDTIDDRVEKLWLSDESGRDSFMLTEENCHHFAARYLSEYHRMNGLEGVSSLYPFNREVLVRIYRALPQGKGKARYFLRHLRTVLEQVVQGDMLLEAVAEFARTETVARCTDKDLAAVCELYGPLVPDDSVRQVTLPAELMWLAGRPAQDTVVPVEPLLRLNLNRPAISQVVDDEEKAAVRDWLLGRPVNRQLLNGVRRGTARWLRATCRPGQLHREGIARPHGVLRWHRTYLGTRPPVCLVGVDDEAEGIPLSREIGLLAFDLHRYAMATGREAKAMTAQLASEPQIASLLFAATDYRQQALRRLTEQLGMPVDELALSLYVLSLIVNGTPDPCPPGFDIILGKLTKHASVWSPQWGELITDQVQLVIHLLFEDFYRLRNNVYDGARVAKVVSGRSSVEALLAPLLEVEVSRLDEGFRLGDTWLRDVLTMVQEALHRSLRQADAGDALSPTARNVLRALITVDGRGVLLSEVPTGVWVELQSGEPEVYTSLRVVHSAPLCKG